MARTFKLTPSGDSRKAHFTIPYAEVLNEQQYAAVTAGSGPHLIVAGAGTGKTRTLVYRVAYLVESGVPPENILLLTFTRRAAREMLMRASDLLDGRCSRVAGGTFHSFCLGILRRYAPVIGFPNGFSILDATDAADVLDVLRTDRGFHRTEKRFPKKNTLQAMFSSVWNRGTPLRDLLEADYPQFIDFEDALRTLAHDYEVYKRRHGLMDYDDLLRRTIELFENHNNIRTSVAVGLRQVLVDEYQDTNAMQARLVRFFASIHNNVTAVGDDAQSIYRFRGADFRNIFDFPKHFPGTEVLKLEHNYRSTQPILDLANHVLSKAHRKYDKELFSEEKDGERPAIVAATDEQEEAAFVAQMMLHLREEGMPLDEMAVLFRSSYNSFELEVELGRRGIPFVKYGGLKLSEAAHVKDVAAYLRVAENVWDAVAWNRVLRLLPGVGPKTAADVIEIVTAQSDDALSDATAQSFPPRIRESAGRLFRLFQPLTADGLHLGRQREAILDHYDPILEKKHADDFPKRRQDLDHLAGMASAYANRADFLAALALDPIELTALDAEATDDDERPVVLSTIHSAKGLEFDAVFLIRALEGVLPSAYALKDADELDEELRLLYVALTRARTQLFISYPIIQHRRFSGDYLADPSRFIADIPETILEPLQLLRESPSSPELGPHDSG